MGTNIKKLVKQNRVKNASELHKKIMMNQIIHALNHNMVKGTVRKIPQKDNDGNIQWYWGLSEWFNEDGSVIDEYKSKFHANPK